MKIAVIDTKLDAGTDGFLTGLLKGLAGKGHDVHLIVSGAAADGRRSRFAETGAVVHSDLWPADGFIEETTPVLADRINGLGPDVYAIADADDVGWTVLPRLAAGIATVAVGHRDTEALFLPARHYRSFLTRVVGVGPEVCVGYVLSSVIDKERVEWIPYGVTASDAEPADADGNGLKIVAPAAPELAPVAGRLTEKGVAFELTVVGDDASFRTIFGDAAGAENIVLLDRPDDDAALAALRRADVFLATAVFDGFSYMLAEAMANGCAPVVGASANGRSELIETGANGFAINGADPEIFAEKLTLLAADRAALLGMRRAAWQTGGEYALAKMVENYENCFAKAVAEASAAPRATYADYPLMETCRSRVPLWLRKLKAGFKS